jgi:hypothetical protein
MPMRLLDCSRTVQHRLPAQILKAVDSHMLHLARCSLCAAGPLQNMYAQLRQGGAAGSMVSWRRMFDFLLSICQLYSDIEADTRVGKNLL